MVHDQLCRIVVVGTSGSGKSTLAKAIAAKLNIHCIELDALYWGPNWTEPPIDVFLDRVKKATASPSWVVEGNYGKVREVVWKNAHTLIWLDYPFHIVFGRAMLRTIKRAIIRESLWNGNRESVLKSFFSKKSILVWIIQTYQRRRREYTELLSSPEYSHLKVLHFRSSKETEAYLGQL
jgi:adenylate kinase family enzyme